MRVRTIAVPGTDRVSTWILKGLVQDWRELNEGHTYSLLAARTGIPPRKIVRVVNDARYVDKLTAARLMAAIGEPLRADLAKIYKAWLEDQQRE